MKQLALFTIIALWYLVACGSTAGTDDTFTFAPTDSVLEFQSSVVTERIRYTDDVAAAVDTSRIASYHRIEVAAGGYDLTTQPLTILATRDGERVRNPIFNILMDVEIVMHISHEGEAKTVVGYEDVQQRIIEYLPEMADMMQRTLNPQTMSTRDQSEWNARVRPLAGQKAVPENSVYTRVDYVLGDGTHVDYIAEVKVVDTFRVDGNLRARVTYMLDTDLNRLAERIEQPVVEIRQALGSDTTTAEASGNSPESQAFFEMVMEVASLNVIEGTSVREMITVVAGNDGELHTGKVTESKVITYTYGESEP